MSKNLPQANNIDKVIDVAIYIYHNPGASLDSIAEYEGFTYRQARYYYDACRYLELVDDSRKPTAILSDIIRTKPECVSECVFERVILDDYMGQIFARKCLFPQDDIESYARNILSIFHPELLSYSTVKRRAHVSVLWCDRIMKCIKNNLR